MWKNIIKKVCFLSKKDIPSSFFSANSKKKINHKMWRIPQIVYLDYRLLYTPLERTITFEVSAVCVKFTLSQLHYPLS